MSQNSPKFKLAPFLLQTMSTSLVSETSRADNDPSSYANQIGVFRSQTRRRPTKSEAFLFFPSERFRQITDADIGAGGQTTGSTFKEIGRDIPLLCVCFTSSLVAKQKMPTFAE